MKKDVMIATIDPKKGIEIQFKGAWSRRMLEQVIRKAPKFHREYKRQLLRAAEKERKENERKRTERTERAE